MYLGIDVGTQSVKALLYDGQAARVVAVESAPLELLSEADGTREQLAGWWISALGRCLAGLPGRDREAVRAVGISGQQHGFVPLDAGGEVLAPVKLWCDTATTAECDEITAAFGGEQRCIEAVGNAILPGYTASKIRWLRNHRPDDYARLDTILLPHDYVNFYLTGERSMECGDASGTGLLDVRERGWHPGMLAALDAERDLAAALPDLAAPGSVIGRVTPAAASELGLPAGIPVATGGGDNMMAAIGTGAVGPGRATASLGTSGTLFASARQPVVDPGGQLAAFCSSAGDWLPLWCTMNCTVSTELTRDLFGVPLESLDDRVAVVPPGSRGVVTVPFFNGERAPNLPAAKGCVLGLDAGNYHPDNLLRASMESAIYGLRTGLDTLRRLACPVDALRLTGGGAASAVWRQMAADILDLPVAVLHIDEGAALGAALQALWTTEGGDLLALVDEHLREDESRAALPSPGAVAAYTGHYDNYLRHVDAVAQLYG